MSVEPHIRKVRPDDLEAHGPQDRGRLTSLLQALPAPEPSAELLAGARRRYREAIEARDRRAVFAGLAAAVVGLGVIVTLLTTTIEPAALVAWLAEVAADLARWAAGVGVVIIDQASQRSAASRSSWDSCRYASCWP